MVCRHLRVVISNFQAETTRTQNETNLCTETRQISAHREAFILVNLNDFLAWGQNFCLQVWTASLLTHTHTVQVCAAECVCSLQALTHFLFTALLCVSVLCVCVCVCDVRVLQRWHRRKSKTPCLSSEVQIVIWAQSISEHSLTQPHTHMNTHTWTHVCTWKHLQEREREGLMTSFPTLMRGRLFHRKGKWLRWHTHTCSHTHKHWYTIYRPGSHLKSKKACVCVPCCLTSVRLFEPNLQHSSRYTTLLSVNNLCVEPFIALL